MEKNTTAPGRAEHTFNAFSRFDATIRSPGTRLYANGRQEVLLQVHIHPHLDGVPAALTTKELASVRLVNYDTDEELPAGWKIGRVWQGYDYYPENGKSTLAPASAGPAEDGKYVIDLFVSTLEGSGLTHRLALALTRESDNQVIITNGTDFWEKDYEVTLRPIKPPSYTIENYPFKKIIVRETPGIRDAASEFDKDRLREDGGSPVFVAYYHLAVVGNDNVPVGFRSMEVDKGGMIQWHDKAPQETFASYVGYGEPNSDEAIYNRQIVYGSHTPNPTISNPIEDKGTIILAGDTNILFDYDSAVYHDGPCKVTAIDANGNDHALNIKFKDDSPTGRFDLELYK